jgi:hypothetical protein
VTKEIITRNENHEKPEKENKKRNEGKGEENRVENKR